MIKIVYELLKDKLNIAKLTFTSGVNAASQEYKPEGTVDRCPLCGIALNENGLCPKCGYKKQQFFHHQKEKISHLGRCS